MSIEQRFAVFHRDNPHVLVALTNLALLKKKEGLLPRIGVKSLFEILRNNPKFWTHGKPYKLDNSFTAAYGALLLEVPELEGFIRVRKRAS